MSASSTVATARTEFEEDGAREEYSEGIGWGTDCRRLDRGSAGSSGFCHRYVVFLVVLVLIFFLVVFLLLFIIFILVFFFIILFVIIIIIVFLLVVILLLIATGRAR